MGGRWVMVQFAFAHGGPFLLEQERSGLDKGPRQCIGGDAAGAVQVARLAEPVQPGTAE